TPNLSGDISSTVLSPRQNLSSIESAGFSLGGYDSVKAKFIEESPDTLIMTSPSFFSQFTLVIATQLVEDSMVKLERICREENVKLVFVRSYGLAGIVRHTIIDSKPDHFLDDLRLNNHGVSQTCHRGRSIVDYSFVILCCLV
ncbi:unnamed protein product, partial [Brassica oleracea]